MIAAVVAFVLALALLAAAYHQSLRIGELNRLVSYACASLAVVPLVMGALLYPTVSVWQAKKAAQAQMEQAQGEAAAVQLVSSKFASMDQYLEYVKARNK